MGTVPNSLVSATTSRIEAVVADYETTTPDASASAIIDAAANAPRAWMLVRRDDEPLGILDCAIPAGGITAHWLRNAVVERFGSSAFPPDPARRTFSAGRDAALPSAPDITVVVCTRNRPDDLVRCLESLIRMTCPNFRILVVDNAPGDDRTLHAVAAISSPTVPIDYVVAPVPGLSNARNVAMARVTTPLVAWLDDDEVADEHWLAEIVRAFADRPGAAAVSGLVVPAELRTRAQLLFESFGGHSKGRGVTPAVFSPQADAQSPLFPLPPFGVGANMAFRTEHLLALGDFDAALGAGSLTFGGEDTEMFTRLLLSGRESTYHPAAITRHYHRPDLPSLERQMYGYGVGLTAFYASLLVRQPRLFGALLRLAPAALRTVMRGDSSRNAGIPDDFPRSFLRRNLVGMLRGPVEYARARRVVRRGTPCPR
ncbi:glycosyltransferase [Cryobacterium sp. SO2]|uniref:glycosyltransferase family 2 protein n=1 Tax=Cryobacterium sp. SO2 TaxID=1897060 RepID=UPI00223E0630|nr:glycosyltransferase family 2 protein [Cryobacterium sp. SO2]WEO76155.1 glycosyltransferase [Cryobacterium sp. SO2]